MKLHYLSIILLSTALLLCSCDKNSNNSDNSTKELSHIKSVYNGITVDADVLKLKDEAGIYNCKYATEYEYKQSLFIEPEWSVKYDSAPYTEYGDSKGKTYRVDNAYKNGFYCCHMTDDNSYANSFCYHNYEEIPDITSQIVSLSHLRDEYRTADGLSFSYADKIRFDDNSEIIYRYQTVDDLPVLYGYSPDLLRWSDDYSGTGIESGGVILSVYDDICYVRDARRFINADNTPVAHVSLIDADSCLDVATKKIAGKKGIYGNNPVVYDINCGYIMIADCDIHQDTDIESDEPLDIPEEFTLVPVWEFRAFFPDTNTVYSAYVNASTGEIA